MDDKTITALAREYAEFTDMSPVDKKNISAICECFLKYTLRRYALVEKNKLKNIHQYIMNKIQVGENLRRKKTIDEGKAQRAIFDGLFPEIAKEAEKWTK